MDQDEELSVPGRVLVETIEFVDLQEIAKGKHGSHRASPERDLSVKKISKNMSSHEEHSYNCLQIALQEGKVSPQIDMNIIHTEEPPRPPTGSPRTPSKDEVLSVVIQKLTELVQNSEQKQKEHLGDKKSGEHEPATGKNKSGTRLYQCPLCPCLFASKHHKKGQLCSCCTRDSRSTSPEEMINAGDSEAHCLRDGQDHRGIACEMCSFKAKTYNELLYHLAMHDSPIFRCKFCNFVTTKQSAIEEHQGVHVTLKVKTCECNICGHKSDTFTSLQNHMKNEHQNIKEVLLKCSECGFSTRSEGSFRYHMWTHVHQGGDAQSSGKSDQERRQKSTSPARSVETEGPAQSLPVGLGRKESKRTAQSAQDGNAMLYKCLLCGYLCEKLSTLKSHAWRHAGQEGCSYPVMHKVQDASEVSAEEYSEDCLQDMESEHNYAEVIEETKEVRSHYKEKPTKEMSKCHCSPIMLPKEEHGIVQKVFADATSVDIEEPSMVSSTTNTSREMINTNDLVPDVMKNESIYEEDQLVLHSTGTEHSKVVSGTVVNSEDDIAVSIFCTDVAVEEVVETVNEPTCMTSQQSDKHTSEYGISDENSNIENILSPDSAPSGERGNLVEKKAGKNLKRKLCSSSTVQDEKKVCTMPGISKMLLSAVDNALQVRANKEHIPQVQLNSNHTKSQERSNVNIVTTLPMPKKEDKYQCPICKQMFPSSVQTHICTQGPTPIFKCNRCPATFWHPGRLQYHMATHEAILKCSDCLFSCNSELALRDHVKKSHLPAKSNICPTCHKDTNGQSPKEHEPSCVLKCWYGCRECDFVAKTMDELQVHGQEIHHKPYKCGMCDYSSATANGIKNHMKFHNADKPYKCPLCDFSGAYPQSLRSHMKKHSASSPSVSNDQFQCKFCSYVSGHLPSMKSHMWRHTSHPGYDYDGQDIIKMVIRVKDGGIPVNQEEALQDIPIQQVEKNIEKPVNKAEKSKAEKIKEVTRTPPVPVPEKAREPQKSKQIQYGSVIFQCSQCGFKSTDHSRLVEHLRDHLAGKGSTQKI